MFRETRMKRNYYSRRKNSSMKRIAADFWTSEEAHYFLEHLPEIYNKVRSFLKSSFPGGEWVDIDFWVPSWTEDSDEYVPDLAQEYDYYFKDYGLDEFEINPVRPV